jgi:CRISPR-associated protein Cas2
VFVAIACELVSEKHRSDVYDLLKQYGFTEVLKDVFESVSIKENLLSRLKRDIDRRTDFYDKIKMYQYPIDGVLVVTMLADKKWRKTVMSLK